MYELSLNVYRSMCKECYKYLMFVYSDTLYLLTFLIGLLTLLMPKIYNKC
uniref:Uncharacterized protein n=1 Tax=Anguilla anguilla TaxID=7936 RepID=A0A0E9UBJ6_ANGAN